MLSVQALAASPPAAAQKPVKTLINSIRYGKLDLAAKQISFADMMKRLLAQDLAKFSDAEQKEFAQGLETVIRADSLPKGKDKFQYLDNVLYEDPREEKGEVRCKTTIVIYKNVKKTELVIDWILVSDSGTLKIADMVLLGESTLDGIREDQVQPLLAEGGPSKVMELLRKKVAEVTKKK